MTPFPAYPGMAGLVCRNRSSARTWFGAPVSRSVISQDSAAARIAAELVGNLVANVAIRCRAEPGDLYAATCTVRRSAKPGSADVRVFKRGVGQELIQFVTKPGISHPSS